MPPSFARQASFQIKQLDPKQFLVAESFDLQRAVWKVQHRHVITNRGIEFGPRARR
jgi:hypothetical protein